MVTPTEHKAFSDFLFGSLVTPANNYRVRSAEFQAHLPCISGKWEDEREKQLTENEPTRHSDQLSNSGYKKKWAAVQVMLLLRRSTHPSCNRSQDNNRR
ncbi:MAG: hypothetical protein COA48_08510 [Cycloclasticus sp.]|nr:MAG: hypothetical protein COA48_08510 [Cycloclasticus sp.]